MLEADAHAVSGDEHDLIVEADATDPVQLIAFHELDGDHAALADILKVLEGRFFHRALHRGHDQALIRLRCSF